MSPVRFVCVAAAFLVLGACALSPQQVALRPQLEVAAANYGQQRSINVRVEDRRSNPVIGTRGGVYGNTSTIEVGNNHLQEIARSLAGALGQWGFRSEVEGYRGEALEFLVSLDHLSYRPDSSVGGVLVITADVSLRVEYGDSYYTGKYSASQKLRYATLPSEEKNNEEINKVLSLALEKIFQDQGLIAFLRQ